MLDRVEGKLQVCARLCPKGGGSFSRGSGSATRRSGTVGAGRGSGRVLWAAGLLGVVGILL